MEEPARKPRVTFAAYLAHDYASELKHEYVDGEVFAMSGATPEHGCLCATVSAALGNQLCRGPCRVFMSGVRVRVPATGLATYPGVVVVRGKLQRDPEDGNTIINPIVVVEVMGRRNAAYDRRSKLAHYRLLPSLAEYVLVSQGERHVEHGRRKEDGAWTLHDARGNDVLVLASIGCKLALDEVYRGVFEEEAAG
jgi:Uma2 family endonuclease